MTQQTVYIASCDSETGGIYRYSVGETLRFVDSYALDRPMYLAIEGARLYAVLLAPFTDNENSGLCSFAISPDGSLTDKTAPVSTQNHGGCHVLAESGALYIAHYSGGSVAKLPDTLSRHSELYPDAHAAPHPHQCVLTPDKQYVCVPDLGLDSIVVYDRALCRVSELALARGSGPRHMVFSPDGRHAFCVGELDNTVSVLAYERGRLRLLHTADLLPDERKSGSAAAAIRINADGSALYVSNRGDDSITRFSVRGAALTRDFIAPCGGAFPRDFCLLPDDRLLVTHEHSGHVALFTLHDGTLKSLDSIQGLRAPLCVV